MKKLKIAVNLIGKDTAGDDLIRQICEDPAMMELCTPVAYGSADAGTADAAVVIPTTEPVECPADAIEIIVTDKTNFMPLAKEPTAEDLVKFRDILERDLDLRSPRIAIVQEKAMQNPDLANQVTAEQGFNIYGPYSVEQILAEDVANHFDGIVVADSPERVRQIVAGISQEAPVRFFAGRESVVTAAWYPTYKNDVEEGLADVSGLTHPFYTATDIVRNRSFYDEARQNPLPKLFRDKREDRRKEDAPGAGDNKDDKEQAS